MAPGGAFALMDSSMRGQHSGRLDRFVAWGGFAILVALHLDVFGSPGAELRLGWLPDELAYRLVWILLAWGYLLFLCTRLWPEGEE